MGFLSLTYRRPAFVDKPEFAASQASLHNDGVSTKSLQTVQSGETAGGIPLALSFDRIMEGGTCPVRTYLTSHSLADGSVC